MENKEEKADGDTKGLPLSPFYAMMGNEEGQIETASKLNEDKFIEIRLINPVTEQVDGKVLEFMKLKKNMDKLDIEFSEMKHRYMLKLNELEQTMNTKLNDFRDEIRKYCYEINKQFFNNQAEEINNALGSSLTNFMGMKVIDKKKFKMEKID